MAKPRLRDNANRFQKYTTVYITKELEKQAKALDFDIKQDVANKLKETYVDNVLASYTPRSVRGQEIKKYNEDKYTTHRKKVTYRHTGIFANSIYTKIDKNNIKVMIRDEQYSDGASTIQVYKWLTEGTEGGNSAYPYIKMQGTSKSDPNNYSTGWSRNFPTPAHLFEEHTKVQIKGYLDTLSSDIKTRYKELIKNKK